MSSEKVEIHPCIENGDHVKIVADVLVVNGLKYVRLIAHGPRCKQYPKEPECSCMNVIGG